MTHILCYSVCAVVLLFITGIVKTSAPFFLISTSTFPAEKSAFFFRCFIQNSEEIDSLKNEKKGMHQFHLNFTERKSIIKYSSSSKVGHLQNFE